MDDSDRHVLSELSLWVNGIADSARKHIEDKLKSMGKNPDALVGFVVAYATPKAKAALLEHFSKKEEDRSDKSMAEAYDAAIDALISKSSSHAQFHIHHLPDCVDCRVSARALAVEMVNAARPHLVPKGCDELVQAARNLIDVCRSEGFMVMTRLSPHFNRLEDAMKKIDTPNNEETL